MTGMMLKVRGLSPSQSSVATLSPILIGDHRPQLFELQAFIIAHPRFS
jgi:hypothetical protein